MRKLCIIAGLVMLAGCSEAPANTTTTTEQASDSSTDPNLPDSFGVVKICKDGTKVYLLTGGNANGKYAVFDSGGKWELLADTASPDTVCSN